MQALFGGDGRGHVGLAIGYLGFAHHLPDGGEAAATLRGLAAGLEHTGYAAGPVLNSPAYRLAVDGIADADIHDRCQTPDQRVMIISYCKSVAYAREK